MGTLFTGFNQFLVGLGKHHDNDHKLAVLETKNQSHLDHRVSPWNSGWIGLHCVECFSFRYDLFSVNFLRSINMSLIWGIVLIIFGLIAWMGQAISAIAPNMSVKWGLSEHESEVDPSFWADVRGETIWDAITLWTMPMAGILLLLKSSLWAFFGLIGGGMYLYFAGRGILTRFAMQRHGIRIGKPGTLNAYYVMLVIWGIIAVVTIIIAVMELPLWRS
jgi:hypothetical protein